MKVLFVTHYFAPEVGAPQTRLRETIRELVAVGHEARVVTGQPHYPDGVVPAGYRALAVRRDFFDGVPVIRLPVLAVANRGFLPRIADQAFFAFCALAALDAARWSDLIVIESPPLFLAGAGRVLAAAARKPYVLHVADPWPDYPIEIGAVRNPLVIKASRVLERFAYAGAVRITTPTTGCANVIEKQDVAVGKVEVIANGVDVERFSPAVAPRAARRRIGWPDRPSIAYVGTVGLAQGTETIVRAVERLAAEWAGAHNRPLVHIVGDGVDRPALERAAARLGDSLVFHGPVDTDEIPAILAACDVILVLLKKGPLASAALPTKLVEGMAAGRAVIASAAGAASKLVVDFGAGLAAAPEDPVALADAIVTLLSNEEMRSRMGSAGRELAIARFSRRATARQAIEVWASAVQNQPQQESVRWEIRVGRSATGAQSQYNNRCHPR